MNRSGMYMAMAKALYPVLRVFLKKLVEETDNPLDDIVVSVLDEVFGYNAGYPEVKARLVGGGEPGYCGGGGDPEGCFGAGGSGAPNTSNPNRDPLRDPLRPWDDEK